MRCASCIRCGSPCGPVAPPSRPDADQRPWPPRTEAEIAAVLAEIYAYQPPDADLLPAEPSRATALHEAAHATAWLGYGGTLAQAGVSIRDRLCVCFITSAPNRYEAEQVTGFAGLAAESRYGGGHGYVVARNYSFALEGARLDAPGSCDECKIVRRILRHRRERGQRTTDRDIAREWRFWNERTAAFVSRADVWASILRVTDAFLAKGRLSDAEVRSLMPDSVFLDGDRRPVWQRLGFDHHPFNRAA
jgi:hypothetical protein